jgi:CheY-like chemotaxis protein
LGARAAATLQNLESAQSALKGIAKTDCEPMPYGKVLVVDDVDSNLYVAKGFLAPYGLAVETATGGQEAIDKVAEGNVYDIIFMDHMMPDMDGVEATEIIRSMGYGHPIVALTANAFSDSVQMFMDNGFSGFISKPIDLLQLDKYLLRFIRDKQPPEVIEGARMAKSTAIADAGGALSEMLVDSFLRDAKTAFEILEGLDTNGLKPYVIQAHAMKSALYNINRRELSEEAFKLEQAGRNEDIHTITDTTPQF